MTDLEKLARETALKVDRMDLRNDYKRKKDRLTEEQL